MRPAISYFLAGVLLLAAPSLRADVFTNVAEATSDGYVILYELGIPNDGGFRDGTSVPYSTDNSGTVGPYDRVAYYLELDTGSGADWAYVSMPAFDQDPARLGLPHNVDLPVVRQQQVDDINIFSNVAGVTTGTGLNGGGLEMWPSDYVTTNDAGVPGASNSAYDHGDGGAGTGAGYGSFQIHNRTAGEVIMAYNKWGVSGGGNDELGIGDRPTSEPDWTFAGNAGSYTVKNLQILVRPLVTLPAPAPIVSNVPEAASYNLVYELDIATQNDFSSSITYLTDNAAAHLDGSFGRIGYYVELDSEWVWVSMASFINRADRTGVPRTGDHFQQRQVSNMNISASVGSGVTSATGIQTGCLEFWNTDYDPGTSPKISGGSNATRDFNDTPLSSGSFGSMQAHNTATSQTVFAFNNWNNSGVASDLGIGNQGTGEPDWSSAANAGSFTTRKLYVLVEPRADDASFSVFPQDLQLYPRNLGTGDASVTVTGTESAGGYADAVLRVFRDDVQVGSDQVQALAYTMGVAPISFSTSITGELANYDFDVFLRDGAGVETLARRANDVVAGDVYIIQGQSNATAAQEFPTGSSADGYIHPYVRTYGLNTPNGVATAADTSWRIAVGDDGWILPGGIGQWGLVLGNKLATDNNIPVAILNGSHPGEDIGFFQRDDGSPTDLSDNYGRLLHRMQAAGIDDSVRSILFYQGEGDVDNGPVHEAGYIALRADWLADYSTVERFFLVQVREGCAVSRFNVDLRNRQRLLADQFADVSVLSAHGIEGHVGCHYNFTDGYEVLGTNIARTLQRDIYGGSSLPNTDPPNPASAELFGAGDDKIRINLRNTTDTVTFDPGAESDFQITGAAVSVLSGAIVSGNIELQLSGSALGAISVEYAGHSGSSHPESPPINTPWVENANGIGLLTFSEPIIVGGPDVTITQPAPAAMVDVGVAQTISGTAAPDADPITLFEVLVDGAVIASVPNSGTISTSWTPLVPDTYQISLRATDSGGVIRSESLVVFAGLPTTPAGITNGLQVWLRPGIGLTLDGNDRVSGWADQSGNGHDATQGTAGARPLPVGQLFGSEPGLRFDGDDFLDSSTGMPTGNYTKIVSYKLLDLAADNQLLSSGVSLVGAHSLTHDATANARVFHNGLVVTSNQGVGVGADTFLAATYDSTSNQAELFVNGASAGTGTAVGDNITATYQVGAYAGNFFLEGDIGEVLIYDRVLSGAELAAINDYLSDRYPPVITLTGDDPQMIECGQAYAELGATAIDNSDGDISGSIVINAAAVNTAAPGSYPVTYDVSDAAGNVAAQVVRTVTVQDTTLPVITLLGDPSVNVEYGQPYSDAGATASDNCDGNLTGSIVTSGLPVDTSVLGPVVVTYNVSDLSGNMAAQVARTVTVVDTVIPVVTVNAVVTNDPTPPLGGSIDDSTATINVTVGGGTHAAVNNGASWSLGDDVIGPLAEGTYDVTVAALDPAGNVGADLTVDELVIDLTTPGVTVNAVITNDPTPPLGGSIDDSTATINVTVGGGTHAAVNNGASWSIGDDVIGPLAEGTYDVTVSALDAAGNAATDLTVDELVIDLTGPGVTVNAVITNDPTPPLGGSVDDSTATINVTVGGGTHAAVNNGASWSLGDDVIGPLAEGTYDVTVAALDPAGNVGADLTVDELVIDLTTPGVTVSSLVTNDPTPPLGGSVDDSTATINVTVGGGTHAAVNNGASWSVGDDVIGPLAEGTYDVTVAALDTAGNAGADLTVDELVIDLTGPGVTVNAVITNDPTPPLGGSVDDSTATINVTVGGGTHAAVNNGASWSVGDDVIGPLAEGTYDVTVAALDTAGNAGADLTVDELVIDLTGPGVTVSSLVTNDPTPPLGGSVDDSTATISVTVGGGTYGAVNNGASWSVGDDVIGPLAEGTYDVTVAALDPAGNAATDLTVDELVIDLTTPGVTVSSLVTNDPTPPLGGSVDDSTATINVTVGGGTYGAVNNGASWSIGDDVIGPLAEGTYDVTVAALDTAGNAGADLTVDELVIDLTTPGVTVNAVVTNDPTPPLGGSVDDSTATISVTVGGGTHAAVNNGASWSIGDDVIGPLAEGTYDVTVAALDTAGNAGADLTVDELVIDLTGPGVTVNAVITNDPTPPLGGSVDDSTATISVTVGGGTHAAVNNGASWSVGDDVIGPLAEGTYDVTVAALDAAGNGATDLTVDELVIDLTTPGVTVSSLVTNDPTPPLGGSVDDSTATINVTVGGGTHGAVNNGASWSVGDDVIGPLAEGTYDVTVAALDTAGNAGADLTVDELVIDLTTPGVTVNAVITNDPTPPLGGSVDDSTATINVTVGGGTHAAVNNGASWSLGDDVIGPLAEGTYDVTVAALDTAGNAGADLTVDELVIDLTAPGVTVNAVVTNDPTPPLGGSVDDSTATISVTVGGGTHAAVNNGASWSLGDDVIGPLTEGTYDVTVAALDTAGNAATDLTVDELVIDLTGPGVTVNAVITNDPTPPLGGSIDDSTATINVTVGGGTYGAVNNGASWSIGDDVIGPLAEGTYDVTVAALDPAGNAATDLTVDELVIDLTTPGVTVNAVITNDPTPPLGGSIDDSTATINVTVGGGTYGAVNNGASWSIGDDVIGPLAEGTYDVTVAALDPAGNAATDLTVDELVIDLTTPGVTVSSLVTNDPTPPLGGSVDDSTATISVTVGGGTYGAVNNGASWSIGDDVIGPLAEGTYDVTVAALDPAGNAATDLTVDELVIDLTTPGVTVSSLVTNDPTPPLGGSVDDSTATISVTVGGGTYGAVNNGASWSIGDDVIGPLTEGTYDVTVAALDTAGNAGADLTVDELVIDLTTPGVTVSSLVTNDPTPPLGGSVDDSTATINVTVGGGTYGAVNNGASWSIGDDVIGPLAEGTYDVTVSALDAAGNAATDLTVDELVIDLTTPGVTVSSLVTNDPTPPLGGSVDDSTATINVTVGGGTYGAVNNGASWSIGDDVIGPLAEGTYDVTVAALDTAGNAGADLTVDELVIDLTTPGVTVNAVVTNDPTPPLGGSVDDSTATISVTVGGGTHAAVNNGASWSIGDDVIGPLAEGTYDVTVAALDPAGNAATDLTVDELVIDLTTPGVTVSSLVTNDPTPPLGGSIDDSTATINVTVGGGTHAAVNNGASWSIGDDVIGPLAEGTYDVTVAALDPAGNGATDLTVDELVIDLTTPGVTVSSLVTNDPTPPLGGSIDDSTATISVTVGGGTYGAVNNGASWSIGDDVIGPLAEGTYDVTVAALDAAGNVGADLTVDELVIDLTGPGVTVSSLVTNDPTPPLGGSVDDSTATISVTVGGGTYGAVNNGASWSIGDDVIGPLAEGTYDVTVSALDAAGNVGADLTVDELVIDLTGPGVTVNAVVTNDPTPPLGGSVDDSTATISVTVGGGTYGAVNNGASWSIGDDVIGPLAEGTYDVTVSALDAAGNVGADLTVDELVIDLTGPGVTVNAVVTNDPTPPLGGSVDDSTATISVTVGGGTYGAVNNGASWSIGDDVIGPLAEGTYDVTVAALDAAGNVGADLTVDELVIDLTGPGVTVNAVVTNDPTPLLGGSVDDSTATINVTVGGGTYGAVNNGASWSIGDDVIGPLAEGTYDVTVAALDAAGNAATDLTVDELVIDLTGPGVTVNAVVTNDPTPPLGGSVDDSTATINVTVGGGTYGAVNNGASWSIGDDVIGPLAEGTYDVTVSALDAAGNAATDLTVDELVIDLTGPGVTVNAVVTNDPTPPLGGSVDDSTATINVTVGGGTYGAVNNGASWSLGDDVIGPLAEGTYDVTVSALDAAGNAATDLTVDELVIDLTGPGVTVNAVVTNDPTPPLGGSIDDSTATINVTVGGGTYGAVNNGASWSLGDDVIGPLAEGTYDVTVSALDAAGNAATDLTVDELVIDLTGPGVTVNAVVTNDPTPPLGGSIDDSTATINVTVGGGTYGAVNNGASWSLGDDVIGPLAEGTYDVTVSALDTAGNAGADLTVDELVIDLTTPGVTVSSLVTNDPTPPLGGSIDDSTATINVTVGGGTYGAVNNGASWSLGDDVIGPLAEGTYDVTVSALDTAGNAGADLTVDELVIDLTTPGVTVSSLVTNDPTPPLGGSVDDSTATISVTVGGGTYGAVNNGASWSIGDDVIGPLAEGTYDVTVAALDAAGNAATDLTVDELVIDLTTPGVTVTSLVTNDPTPPLGGSVDDSTATISVTVGGGTYGAVNNGASWSIGDDVIGPLAEGTYDVTVAALDPAGNAATDLTVDELVIDLTTPGVTVTSLATNDTTPALGGTVDDSTAVIIVIVGGNAYAAVNTGSAWSLADDLITPALAEGTYDVTVAALDGAGNVGTDITVNELVIDLTTPVVTVDGLNTNDATPPLGGSVDDSTAVISVTVGGNIYAGVNTGSAWILADDLITPALTDGTYEVAVTATDGAGNVGADGTSNELVVDTEAPALSLVGANPLILCVDESYVDPGATATDAVDGDLTSEIVVGGDAVVTTMPATLTVTYDVTDASGNTDHVERTVMVIELVTPGLQYELLGNPTKDLKVSFQSTAGLSYLLLTTTDLVNWTALGSSVGDGSVLSITHIDGGIDSSRFYKLEVSKSSL